MDTAGAQVLSPPADGQVVLESVTCRARVGARYRLPADPVLLAHAGVVVLAVGVLLHGAGTPLTLGRLSWSASVIFDTTAMLTARRIVRLLPAGKGAAAGYPAEGYPALAGDRSVDDY